MERWNEWAALAVLLSMLAGMIRVFRGPTRADRMLAAQLCGTSSAAVLLLLAFSQKNYALCDIALVFTLLAATASVAFVRLTWRYPGSAAPSAAKEEVDDAR